MPMQVQYFRPEKTNPRFSNLFSPKPTKSMLAVTNMSFLRINIYQGHIFWFLGNESSKMTKIRGAKEYRQVKSDIAIELAMADLSNISLYLKKLPVQSKLLKFNPPCCIYIDTTQKLDGFRIYCVLILDGNLQIRDFFLDGNLQINFNFWTEIYR